MKTYHIIYHGHGKWCLRRKGAVRAIKIFDSKDQAVAFGFRMATVNTCDLFIHGRDGLVEGHLPAVV